VSETNPRFDVQPTASNHFAWINTALGLQRTLMAAVRTGVSLIGFGFTVAQFFERLQGNVPASARLAGPEAARNLGLLLIAAGVVSVATFTWDYHRSITYMQKDFASIAITGRVRTSSYATAFVVMLIGVAAFVSVFARF
jgi:putative membrane protein